MKYFNSVHIYLLLFTIFNSDIIFLNNDIDFREASKAADSFLHALKIKNTPEGQEMLYNLTFCSYDSYPVLIFDTTIYESLFPTDINTVLRYRRHSIIRGVNRLGTSIEERYIYKEYILVLYKNQMNDTWEVFDFRESINMQHEEDSAQDDLVYIKPFDTREDHQKYNNLAYWQIMNGNILAAYRSYEKAVDSANKANDEPYNADRISVLEKIIPKSKLN